MKRQRIGISAIPVVARARPVLRSSTKLNRMQVTASECMSYKELVKVVGVDCEASPSSWRKAIDHSAETVVFFQVDLRGVLPRMCKSVRICQEEEKLVPSVYIGESLLSATYVKTIIGKRFLTDEDDLMKLLEHAGILHEDGEFFEENAEDGDGGHGAEEGGENDPFEPEPKRARVAEKEQVVVESALSSGRRITRSSATALISQITAEPSLSASGGRQPVDLSPLLLLDKPNSMLPSSSRVRQVSLPVDDSLMAADFDDEDLPAADDVDNFPLVCGMQGSSKMEESGEEMTDVLPDAGSNRGGAEMEETSGLDPVHVQNADTADVDNIRKALGNASLMELYGTKYAYLFRITVAKKKDVLKKTPSFVPLNCVALFDRTAPWYFQIPDPSTKRRLHDDYAVYVDLDHKRLLDNYLYADLTLTKYIWYLMLRMIGGEAGLRRLASLFELQREATKIAKNKQCYGGQEKILGTEFFKAIQSHLAVIMRHPARTGVHKMPASLPTSLTEKMNLWVKKLKQDGKEIDEEDQI
ncbi:uncharacterized protein LOC129585477 isoform X2 [Paramacrobiotus metropolitanus]|uniref:uncharacterized protein LOC129585477 isoform X2 n=1 Tax=Paramacrobiotus metropolitanus TaxID=2943436 RepID=UPI00244568FF|nr:uncharacterized protein LOC129585477 isoform X2 [Paramacrobiotus metropolitanus]